MDPSPPSPPTYLDKFLVQFHVDAVLRAPDSPEHLYRRLMVSILRFLFPEREGYDDAHDSTADISRPNFYILKACGKPDGTIYQYEYLLVESKKPGQSWVSTEDRLHNHLAGNTNESKNVYGMIQIGLEVRFYKYEGDTFSRLGDKMHLVRDASQIMQRAWWLRNNPMGF